MKKLEKSDIDKWLADNTPPEVEPTVEGNPPTKPPPSSPRVPSGGISAPDVDAWLAKNETKKGLTKADVAAWIAKNEAAARAPEDDEDTRFLKAGLQKQDEVTEDGRQAAKADPALWPNAKNEDKDDGKGILGTLKAGAYGYARGATLGAVDRLVGVGSYLGDRLASTVYDIPANQNAYQEGRREYLDNEAKATDAHPIAKIGGELVGNVVTSIASAPLAIAGKVAPASKLAGVGLRAVDQGIQGAVSGAMNTGEDDAEKMWSHAKSGFVTGAVADATMGSIARKLGRGSIDREAREVMSDISEAATKQDKAKLIKDLPDVRDILEKNADVRKATSGLAEKGLKVIDAHKAKAMAGQALRYRLADAALRKEPLTLGGYFTKLDEAKKTLTGGNIAQTIKAIDSFKDNMESTARVLWGAKDATHPLTMQQLRQMTSQAQAVAEATAPGTSFTGQVKHKMSEIANNILEERLDMAVTKVPSLKHVVKQIRESDRQFSALSNIEGSLEKKATKQIAETAGISNITRRPLEAIKEKGADALRRINQTMLMPIEAAARKGATWGEVSRMAMEKGLPQGVARALYARAVSVPPYQAVPIAGER